MNHPGADNPQLIPYPGGSATLDEDPFVPRHGEAVLVEPGIARITADNASHFTFMGTNGYLIEAPDGRVVIIDPGPDIPSQLKAWHQAIAGRSVAGIFITHTHVDHSPALKSLRSLTNAPTFASGPHCLARPLVEGETNLMQDAGDWVFRPDKSLFDGEVVDIAGLQIEALFTPGHAANHMAFAIQGRGIVFSGDNVMAHTSTIVGPPEGSMRDYLATLNVHAHRDDALFFPGHGGRITTPHQRVQELLEHRARREKALLGELSAHPVRIEDLVQTIYRDIPPLMVPAAALSVQAQLEHLVDQGRVISTGAIPGQATYQLKEPGTQTPEAPVST